MGRNLAHVLQRIGDAITPAVLTLVKQAHGADGVAAVGVGAVAPGAAGVAGLAVASGAVVGRGAESVGFSFSRRAVSAGLGLVSEAAVAVASFGPQATRPTARRPKRAKRGHETARRDRSDSEEVARERRERARKEEAGSGIDGRQ